MRIKQTIDWQNFYQEAFYFTACLWLSLVVLEIIWPNIVLAYFNLNWLLIAIIILGLLSIKRSLQE